MKREQQHDQGQHNERACWVNIQNQLKEDVSIFIWNGYVRQLSCRQLNDTAYELSSPHAHILSYVETHLRSHLEARFTAFHQRPIELHIVQTNGSRSKLPQVKDERQPSAPVAPQRRPHRKTIGFTQLSHRTQKTFSVLKKHIQVQHDGLFVLVGASGTGKTYALRTAYDMYRAMHPTQTCRFVSGEQWVNEYIEAARMGRMTAFNHKWRQGYDVLFVDDVDFLNGKLKSQENFQKLLDVLSRRQVSVYMATSVAPARLEKWDKRLKSRLCTALSGHLFHPTSGERLTFIEHLAEQLELRAEEGVWQEVALKAPPSFSILKGLMTHIHFFVEGTVSHHDLVDILPAFVDTQIEKPSVVIKNVAQTCGLETSHLTSSSRLKHISQARVLAAHILATRFHASLQEIGRLLNRHPSSVHAMLKRANQLKAEDMSFATLCRQYEAQYLEQAAPQQRLI